MGAKVSVAILNGTSMQRLSLKRFGVLETWAMLHSPAPWALRILTGLKVFPTHPPSASGSFLYQEKYVEWSCPLQWVYHKLEKTLGEGPGNVLFSYSDLHPAPWHIAFPDKRRRGGGKKKEKKLNGTEYQLGIENYFKEWGLWAEGLHEASGKLLGAFSVPALCHGAGLQFPRRFRSDSTLMPLMSELGWHVQINMKYFVAMSQWQQPLFHIYACKMLLHRIREDFCAMQAPVTSLL